MTQSVDGLSVLQVIKGLDIGNIHGGAEKLGVELAIELARNGVAVSVCAFFEIGSAAEKKWGVRLRENGVPFFHATRWEGNNNFRNYLRGAALLESELSHKRVDVCHSHFQLGTICALWLKGKRLATTAIRTQHVTSEWERGWYGALRCAVFSKWLFPFLLDAEVGVSQDIAQTLQNHPGARINRRKAVCIYNGISTPEINQAEIRLSKNGIVIGSVGRLTEVKNYDILISALPYVRKMIPNAVLWLVGNGEERERLERMAGELEMSDVVKFWGNQDDVRPYLHQMDLFVLPSKREGIPTAILESFSLGIPVVGANVTGIRELVVDGKTGWLVRELSAVGLANTIITALQDTQAREEFARAGLERVKDFSMGAIAGQYLALYEQVTHQGT